MSYKSSMGKAIRELRFVMCQQSGASMGARKFVSNNYVDIKGANPTLPFVVRQCLGAQPNVMARYDFGVEKRIYLNDLSEQEVEQAVIELVEDADQVNAAMPGH